MAELQDLVVPPMGESITSAVVTGWLKRVGDPVEADEPVLDLETDKIAVQLPAPARGVLREQRVGPGETVSVGQVVGNIEVGGVAAAAAPGAAEAARPAPQADGKPAQAARPAEEAARPVQGAEAARPVDAAGPGRAAPAAPAAPAIDDEALRRLSPAKRRAARLGEGEGEGKHRAAAHAQAAPAPAPAPERAVQRPAPAVRVPGAPSPARDREEIVPMTPLRKRIAERLVQAQHESASLTTFNEVDMSAVMNLRSRHKDAFAEAHGVKLGFLSFFVKACVAACQRFPGLNAEIRDSAIVYKKHYDFGIAVSTDRGLVVPVLRSVDALGFAEIEQGVLDLAQKARSGKLTLDDLTGGTFSITNGGIFGSMLSTPLLNYPQTGILGMHNIVNRPVAVGDRVEVHPVMYIALTYDHRVVDGREAVQFLVAVKERLESPEKLMFGL